MTSYSRAATLSPEEIAFLRRPENMDFYVAYGDALAALHGLVSRCTGSWTFVRIVDEAEALQVVRELISQMAPLPWLAQRASAYFAAAEALRKAAAQEGLTDRVRTAANELIDALLLESEALEFGDAEPFVARRAAAG